MENAPSNKKNIIIVVVVLALLVGGAVVFKGKKGAGDSMVAPLSSTKGESQISEKGSLKDLLSRTSPSKCIVTSKNETEDSIGTVYISDGKMRSDFTTTMKNGSLAGKVITAHMIIDTDTSYMWGDNESMKMGIKMSRQATLDVAPQTSPNSPQAQAAMDMNEQSDYDCEGWSVDASLFIPPANINFTDMSKMMENLPKMPTGNTGAVPPPVSSGSVIPQTGVSEEQLQAMCGSCDQAGPNRDQCRQALGCK